MVTASVGFQCPECAGIVREGFISGAKSGGTRTSRPWRKHAQIHSGHEYSRGAFGSRGWGGNYDASGRFPAPLAITILSVNLVFFIFSIARWGGLRLGSSSISSEYIEFDYGLAGYFLEVEGEWWRIFTSGFVHSGLLHIAFNMLLFWILSLALEPRFGSARFALLYLSSIVGGAFGALLLQSSTSIAVGASGGIFGLMGAYVVVTKFSGLRILDSPISLLLVINLALTFLVGGISIGGHIGGLLAGIAIGVCYTYLPRDLFRPGLGNFDSASRPSKLATAFMYVSATGIGGILFLCCLMVGNYF